MRSVDSDTMNSSQRPVQIISLCADIFCMANMRHVLVSVCLFTLISLCALYSQEAIPFSYRGIELGMDMESVQAVLSADPLFGYRGERDVSLLPTLNRSLIESSGTQFIRRSWFQFHENSLYIMIFALDAEKTDYFSLYSHLVALYGEPDSLDPAKAVWADETTMLTLERPLTVKYVNRPVFDALVQGGEAERSRTELLREDFIADF